MEFRKGLIAPKGNPGRVQVIPNIGAHDQFYCSQETVELLVLFGLVKYEPDYGPNANVYIPVHPADSEKVRSWIPRT